MPADWSDCLNIANVISRFALFSGLDISEAYKQRDLIDEACEHIGSLVLKNELDSSDVKRLDTLCAAYAFKLYSLCNNDNITSFVAGDVHITSPADGGDRAQRLWEEYSKLCEDLIGREDFLFGRVM